MTAASAEKSVSAEQAEEEDEEGVGETC